MNATLNRQTDTEMTVNDTAKTNTNRVIAGAGIYKGSPEKLAELTPTLLGLTEVRLFNLSVPQTLASGIRIWESFQVDKPIILQTFTPMGFDPAAVDNLPTRIGVLWYCNVQLGQLIKSSALDPALVAVAKPLHAKLARAALYLFEDDPLLGPVVIDIRHGSGHLDMADDLARYSVLFDDNWERIEGRCDITRADITTAGDASAEMLRVLTEDTDPQIKELKDLRARAADYLRRGTDAIRRAAAYIIEDEAELDARYPSLYKKTTRKKNQPEPQAPLSNR